MTTPAVAVVRRLAFVLQFADGGRITSQAVSGEHPRGSIIGIRQGSLQEAFGGFPSPFQWSVHRLEAPKAGLEHFEFLAEDERDP